MKASPLTLLAARLNAAAYEDAYMQTGAIDLSAFFAPASAKLAATIWANDPKVGRIRHGFIAVTSTGEPFWIFAGTLCPSGNPLVEWLDDFDAALVQSPWNEKSRVHRGFQRFTDSISIEMDGVELWLRDFIVAHIDLVTEATFAGHSLGTYCAAAAFMWARTADMIPYACIQFAAPKGGDGSHRKDVVGSVQAVQGIFEAYKNRYDAVPELPFTIEIGPWVLADFEPVVDPVVLDPRSVSPAVESDWASAHHMPNYVRLLAALT